MSKFSKLGHELYTGKKSYDFVGRRALWYVISAVIVAAALLVVLIKGLAFGIEFTGGVQFKVDELTSQQASQSTVDDLRDTIAESGVEGTAAPIVSTSGPDGISIKVEELTQEATDEMLVLIADSISVTEDQISHDEISASWGAEVAQRALLGVIIFVVLSMLFIALYFREWKMALAAFIALAHDVIITVGVYSLSGFSVTPAAVTGLLAILGFSLYDTVIVFDKVRENTKGLKRDRRSYADAANLAVNQTLVRSINTSIVALIPLGAILYVSAVQLGASSLKDLALAQFVGMAVGVFSSVWVAPRILVHLKSNESEVQLAEKRAKARAKGAADKYAAVPTTLEGLGVAPEAPAELRGVKLDEDEDDVPATSTRPTSGGGAPTAPDNRPFGKGRVIPPAHGPVEDSGSAGRPQPKRQPKSQRGK